MRNAWEPVWDARKGVWRTDFTVAGERVRRSLGVRDPSLSAIARKAAKAAYAAAWERHLSPVAPPVGAPFFEAAKGYVEAGGDARFLPRLIRHFGERVTIDQIGEPEIAAAGAALYPGRAPDTIRRQVRVPVSAVIRWSRGLRRRPSTDNRRTRWLTPEEAERLIDAARRLTLPRHDRPEPYTLAKIAFLLGSGCRTGECFAADVADWNPATRQIWIAGEAEGAAKTALAARWVRLPARSVALIGPTPLSGRMFRTPYGQPIKMRKRGGGQMAAAFNRARDAAELGADVTPHVLRHTWATWMYAQTRDMGALIDEGGWAKADMANRYRKIAPDDLAERLDAHGWDFRRKSGAPHESADVIAIKSAS